MNITMDKEFKDLGFLDIPCYACSDGHIYDREYHMVNEFGRKGTDSRYKAVSIFGKIYNVHHLIGWAFPEIVGDYESGLQIDHLNTNPSDNRPQNLKWCTAKENTHNPITWERRHSKEYRQKQSDAHKILWDEERRQRQSELQKARWADPNSTWNSEDSRQRASESQKNAWKNPEIRQKHSEAQKKRWENPERRQEQSERLKAMWADPEIRQKRSEPLKKPIIQLTLDGEFIREWDSATDAYDELGIHKDNIGKCCRGKYKSAGGFKWVFRDVFY